MKNSNLTKAAKYYNHYMARTANYGHADDGQMPFRRANKYDYDYCIMAQNIACQIQQQPL